MPKVKIIKVNYGSLPHEKAIADELRSFDKAEIKVSESQFIIKTINGREHNYKIEKSEEDFLTVTYVGKFEDGTKFRVVKSAGIALEMAKLQGHKDSFSLGSVQPSGYAIHFEFDEKVEQATSEEGKNNSNDHNFRFHKEHRHSGHDPIIKFFQQHGFGTNNPVMTFLSVLSTTDRCVILEELFNPNKLNSILSDKLLLAYVTSGKQHLAEKVIENSIQNNEIEINVWGLKSKLDLGLAPTRNRAQRLVIYNDFLSKTQNPLEIKFLNLLIEFCNNHYE